MADKLELTDSERIAILEHEKVLIDACSAEIIQLERIPRKRRPDFVTGQLAYWRNARQALLWSSSIARQRTRKESNDVAGNVPKIT
jgi:hypothetical protein